MKKVFLDDLPRWESKINKGKIKWSSCVGYRVPFIYDDIKGEVCITNYFGGKTPRLEVTFNDNVKVIRASSLYNCEIGDLIKKITKDFKYNIGDQINGKIIKNSIKIGNKKFYETKCLKCGFEGEYYYGGKYNEKYLQSESEIKNRECPCCGKITRYVSTNINSIWKTDYWMVELGVDEEWAKMYSNNSNQKILCVCPHCQRKYYKQANNIYTRKSITCSCGDGRSYISKYMYLILIQLKVKYVAEVKYNWNKYTNPLTNKESQASIDFVIHHNGREIPLEVDGGFHRIDNKMNGQTKEMSKYIDKQRDENCLKYLGEETIRISDEGDIKENILSSKLNELFDLSEIDWNKCEEFALSNRIKGICDLWNISNETVISKFINKHNIYESDTTIRKYLKQGTKYGWCNYEDVKVIRKVLVKKDGVVFGIFDSCNYIETNSISLFGEKFYRGGISETCSGKKKQYKGFTFEYVNENDKEVA